MAFDPEVYLASKGVVDTPLSLDSPLPADLGKGRSPLPVPGQASVLPTENAVKVTPKGFDPDAYLQRKLKVTSSNKPSDDTSAFSHLAGDAKSIAIGLASTPGAVLGATATGMTMLVGSVLAAQDSGDPQEHHTAVVNYANAVGAKIAAKTPELLNHLLGEDNPSPSDVDSAINKIGEWAGKGADWVEKKTSGTDVPFKAGELKALANVIQLGLGGKLALAALGGVKALKGVKELPAEDTPQIIHEDTPAPLKPGIDPSAAAKQHIEETTGIKRVEENNSERKQQRADARAAFAEDPHYADYLRNYADEAVRQRTAANQIEADKLEAQKAANTLDVGKLKADAPEHAPTWQEIYPIIKKPGFSRTAEEIMRLRRFDKQGGAVDSDMLVKMSAIGLGAAAGAYLDPDHPLVGTILGLAGGAALNTGIAKVGGIKAVWTNLARPDTRRNVNEWTQDHQASQAVAARAIVKATEALTATVKLPRREALTHWMQGDKTIPITPKEHAKAMAARKYYSDIAAVEVQEGILKSVIPDYVNQQWDLEGTNKAAWEKLTHQPGMSESHVFTLQRKIESIAEGKTLGLKPVTEDLARLMAMRGAVSARAMANKKLSDRLRDNNVPGTKLPWRIPAKDAPKNYVKIDHPSLGGDVVHPDIATQLKFLYAQRNPSAILAGTEAVSSAIKRSMFSNSIFHPVALSQAYLGAGGNPLKLPATIYGLVAGSNRYLQQLRKGPAGDIIDKALGEGGIKVTLDNEALASEDVAASFYKGLTWAGDQMDKIIPHSGVPFRAYESYNKAMDKMTWARIHTGFKLQVGIATHETLSQNNVEAHASNPGKYPLKTDREIWRIAGDFTNSLFGGLNWQRMAENAQTKWGKALANYMYGPGGRRFMQLAALSPDWTISTTRSLYNALGTGSGIRGLLKPQELADLHRQYVLRTSFYYLTVGNGINYAMSGHPIWENKDKTSIDLGDGRTVPFSKHATDPVHMLLHPQQEFLNKLGPLPAEITEQFSGKEYLSTKGTAPTMDTDLGGRIFHAASKTLPISYSGGVSGALGFPVHGRTEEEQADYKLEQKEIRSRRKQREQEEETE